jgi:predicted O-methyltransferase YrrM
MKPGGRFVELGTGTGAATAWLLDGMSSNAELVTIDSDPGPLSVAREVLGSDPRLKIVHDDADAWLRSAQPRSADLVFADAWPGKYEALEASLALLKPGGIWVGDDLLPQEIGLRATRKRPKV